MVPFNATSRLNHYIPLTNSHEYSLPEFSRSRFAFFLASILRLDVLKERMRRVAGGSRARNQVLPLRFAVFLVSEAANSRVRVSISVAAGVFVSVIREEL